MSESAGVQAWLEGQRKGERGLGDTVKNFLDSIGIHQKVEDGKPCNCQKRQQWLNEKFPYKKMDDAATLENPAAPPGIETLPETIPVAG